MLTGSVVKSEVLPTSPAPRRSLRPEGPEVGFVNAAAASARAPCCLGRLPAARQGGLRAPVVSSAVPPPPSKRRLPRLLPSSFRGVCSSLPLPVCGFARRRRSRDGQIGTRSALPHALPVLAGCLARDGWPVRICISSSSPKWRFRGPRRGRIWGCCYPSLLKNLPARSSASAVRCLVGPDDGARAMTRHSLLFPPF